MPIAPIVGKLRKRFFTDLGLSFGFAIASGYAYWYVPAREERLVEC
jgi:cytochrome c oxidase subunit 7